MQRTYILIATSLTLVLMGCGSPASTQTPVEGTPNTDGEPPKGAVENLPPSTQPPSNQPSVNTTIDKALSALKTPKMPPKKNIEALMREKREALRRHEAKEDKRSKLNSDPSLEPAKKVARNVAAAIIAQDVERARELFLPPALIEEMFPGDACVKERASGEKERVRMERKVRGILRRGSRFLIYGPDNLDGRVEPAQEAKVKLSLSDVTIRRSKTLPKGKTSKRGCTMNKTLVGTRVRLELVASMEGKTAEVPINIEVLKVGDNGWFLAEL